MTACLGVIAAWVAILTFLLDKRDNLQHFLILSVLGVGATLLSIVLGGKGIAAVYKEGANGDWNLNTKGKYFDNQSILALLGVVLIAITALCGTPKTEKPIQPVADIATQRTLNDLIGKVAVLESEYSKLDNQVRTQRCSGPKSRRK